jgi:hypothetical protein
MQHTANDRLLAELDRIHDMIRTGRLDGLAEATSAVEAGLARLEPVDEAGLDLLRQRASRNAACLDSAARGVRAARRRLAEIRAMDSGLATYGDKGRRDELPLPPVHLTQRF